jgi:hypothetical protein
MLPRISLLIALTVGVTAKRSLSDAIWSSVAAQVWLMLLILDTMPLACALYRGKKKARISEV